MIIRIMAVPGSEQTKSWLHASTQFKYFIMKQSGTKASDSPEFTLFTDTMKEEESPGQDTGYDGTS